MCPFASKIFEKRKIPPREELVRARCLLFYDFFYDVYEFTTHGKLLYRGDFPLKSHPPLDAQPLRRSRKCII
ncbi:hypothetical protein HZ326_31342 [Fusarium oxysporum f. sp. albedinis]|nr:hypothetical protein HZ326_31342 [Fusarium oxysporum f. sp. albedinis]